MTILRIRFQANLDDPRPINWPVKYPYWITGAGHNYSTVVSFADSVQYIFDNWPEASNLDIQERDGISFSDRFPKPEWFEALKGGEG